MSGDRAKLEAVALARVLDGLPSDVRADLTLRAEAALRTNSRTPEHPGWKHLLRVRLEELLRCEHNDRFQAALQVVQELTGLSSGLHELPASRVRKMRAYFAPLDQLYQQMLAATQGAASNATVALNAASENEDQAEAENNAQNNAGPDEYSGRGAS